jgi:hypothetical protein
MKVSSLRVFGLGLLTVMAGELAAVAQSSSTNVVRGSIDVPGERDVYTFSLANRARYYFDALTNVSSINWSLESAAGTLVDNRPFGSSDAGNASVLSLEPGFYRLTVDGSGITTNAYSFRFVDLATAGLISPGTLVTNQLNPGTRTDFYQFNSLAGDRLLFDRITTPPAGNIWWRLFDPYANEVFSGGFSDVNNITQRVDGVYTLVIEGYVGNTAVAPYSFSVVLQGNTPPAPFTGTPMSIGTLVSGTLTNVSTNDYVFTVAATTRVVMDTLTNSPSMNWTLEGPPGLLVNGPGFNGADGQNGTAPKELPPGDYRLRLRRSTTGSAPFAFRLLDLASATPITSGVPVNSTHSPGQETDLFRFDATAGSRIYVDMFSTNGVGNGSWRLLDPYLNVLTSSSERTDRGPLTLNLTGTYTLLTEGYFDDTTAQPYRFVVVPVSDSAQTLTIGALTSGSIDGPGQSQQYLFSLATPATLYFDSRTNHGSIRWTLDGPTGRRVNSRGFNSSDGTSSGDPLNLPAGDYTLTVAGTGDATGGFSFRLVRFCLRHSDRLGDSGQQHVEPGERNRRVSLHRGGGNGSLLQCARLQRAAERLLALLRSAGARRVGERFLRLRPGHASVHGHVHGGR